MILRPCRIDDERNLERRHACEISPDLLGDDVSIGVSVPNDGYPLHGEHPIVFASVIGTQKATLAFALGSSIPPNDSRRRAFVSAAIFCVCSGLRPTSIKARCAFVVGFPRKSVGGGAPTHSQRRDRSAPCGWKDIVEWTEYERFRGARPSSERDVPSDMEGNHVTYRRRRHQRARDDPAGLLLELQCDRGEVRQRDDLWHHEERAR